MTAQATRQVLDFGEVKVVAAPEEPISQTQWQTIRAAIGLSALGLKLAAEAIVEDAGLMLWPPKARRTTRPWTTAEEEFVLTSYTKLDQSQLGRSIDRSPRAVEFFLAERGLKAMKVKVIRQRSYGLDGPRYGRNDESAHIAAVLRASGGQGWTR